MLRIPIVLPVLLVLPLGVAAAQAGGDPGSLLALAGMAASPYGGAGRGGMGGESRTRDDRS
jgi:hypothetical protein